MRDEGLVQSEHTAEAFKFLQRVELVTSSSEWALPTLLAGELVLCGADALQWGCIQFSTKVCLMLLICALLKVLLFSIPLEQAVGKVQSLMQCCGIRYFPVGLAIPQTASSVWKGLMEIRLILWQKDQMKRRVLRYISWMISCQFSRELILKGSVLLQQF